MYHTHSHMYHTILLNAKKENEIIMMLGKFTNNSSAKKNHFDSVKKLQGSLTFIS